MKPVNIIIDGIPVAKGRPRISTRGGRPIAFTPAKTRSYENLIKLAAGDVMRGRVPIEGALSAMVLAVLPVPKSWSKKKKLAALSGEVPPITRPDVDNYAKAALDALNEIVFRDDSQVSTLTVRKRYGEKPRLEIRVQRDLAGISR